MGSNLGSVIRGSVSALTAIYNSSTLGPVSNYCTDYRSYVFAAGGDTLLPTGDFDGLKNVDSVIRIQPIDSITGATLACASVPAPLVLEIPGESPYGLNTLRETLNP